MVTCTLCLVAEILAKSAPSQKLTGKSNRGYSWLLSRPRECGTEGGPKSQEVRLSWQEEVASLSITQLIIIKPFVQLSLSQPVFKKRVFQKMDRGCGQKSPKMRRSIAQTIRTLHTEDEMVCFISTMRWGICIHKKSRPASEGSEQEASWIRNCSCLFRQRKCLPVLL